MSVLLFRKVVLIVLDRGPRAIDSLVSLMKHSKPMDRVLFGQRYLLDAKGRQRPFPILDDHVEPVEGIGGSIRGVSGQVESPDNFLGVGVTLSMASPGRLMVSSLVLHVVGGRALRLNVSFARRFSFQDVGAYTETYVHGAGAPNVASAKHASVNSSSFDLVPPEFGNLRARSRTHTADASPTSPWSESFLVVQLVTMMKVMLKGGRGHVAASERGKFSSTATSRLTAVVFRWRGLLRDVNGACNASNWMHGEDSRPAARPPGQDKYQCLRADVQQRVFLAAVRWVDADNAVDEHEALAKLLKERTGYVPGVSNAGSCEYSRVSLPDSVVDAPPLIEILPAEARFFLRSFSHGCCCRRR